MCFTDKTGKILHKFLKKSSKKLVFSGECGILHKSSLTAVRSGLKAHYLYTGELYDKNKKKTIQMYSGWGGVHPPLKNGAN